MTLDWELDDKMQVERIERPMGPRVCEDLLRHVLVVAEWSEDAEHDGDLMWVEHDERCPYGRVISFDGEFSYGFFDCGVEFEISNCGLGTWFVHWDELEDEDRDRWLRRGYLTGGEIPLQPGRYFIEYWSETFSSYTSYYGHEYEAGLRIVDEMA